MKAYWRTISFKRKALFVGILVIVVLGVIGSLSGGNDKATSSASNESSTTTKESAPTTTTPVGDPDVDRHTRAYIAGVQTCQIEAGLVLLDIKRGQTDLIKLADETTTAKNGCDQIRSNLASANTDHFDDQALVAWGGVDRMKSGLNALLAYIDNPEPTKIIEARDKIEQGDRDMAAGLAQINARRRVYGLKPIKL